MPAIFVGMHKYYHISNRSWLNDDLIDKRAEVLVNISSDGGI